MAHCPVSSFLRLSFSVGVRTHILSLSRPKTVLPARKHMISALSAICGNLTLYPGLWLGSPATWGALSQRPVINRLPISDLPSGRADCWTVCITLEASSCYCSGSAGASILLGDCMCTAPIETTQTRNTFLHHGFCDAFWDVGA